MFFVLILVVFFEVLGYGVLLKRYIKDEIGLFKFVLVLILFWVVEGNVGCLRFRR